MRGLPPGIAFSDSDFIRPQLGMAQTATALLTNLFDTDDVAKKLVEHTSTPKCCSITQTTAGGVAGAMLIFPIFND